MYADDDENLTSTPATKKKIVSVQTPDSEAFMSLCASKVKYTLRIIWASTRDNPLSSAEAQI